jgi:Transposase, Mutator family
VRRVAPSVVAGEQLRELLAGGVDRESNVISVLVKTVTRLVVQQLLEAEQADYLGGRGRYERRGEGQVGSRNGYQPGRIRTAEGSDRGGGVAGAGAGAPFRSSLPTYTAIIARVGSPLRAERRSSRRRQCRVCETASARPPTLRTRTLAKHLCRHFAKRPSARTESPSHSRS